MTRPYDMEPTTDAEVFDMVHGLFGIGDYSEDDPRPWHKFRMVEIAKVKAIRRKRKWPFHDFAVVARYCFDTDQKIEKVWDLLQHHGQAMLARIADERSHRDDDARAAAAAELAAGLPDSEEWAGRLLRSTGRGQRELLEEWHATRQRTLEGLM